MARRGLSLAEIQEMPKESLVLLSGPPGAGKSTFCHQIVLNSIATESPIIFVTTEQSPSSILGRLKEKGMGEPAPGVLNFVDAFTETVGLTCTQRPDTICANCADLNSLSMATTRLQEKTGRKGILLAFDSLTSPYLFCGVEVVKFMRLFLGKFAAEGNSVVALVDEGCGKSEDLVAMMSVADGVIKIETEGSRQRLNVVKHPKVMPSTVEIRIEPKPPMEWTMRYDTTVLRQFITSWFRGNETGIRGEIGDFLHPFWPNLSHWSGILWDPKGFPKMIYELNKAESAMARDIRQSREMRSIYPLYMRLLMIMMPAFQTLGFIPKKLNNKKDMKKFLKLPPCRVTQIERSGILEYLEDVSKTDEHYFRIYESSDCLGFENIGTTIASHVPSNLAGFCQGMEQVEREWNAIETKCVGLGDPYCEFKLVPGEIEGLRNSLEKDSSIVERIHKRLIERLMDFLLDGRPLVDRPKLGSDVHLHVAMHAMGFPHVAGERYRMAQRMGGAKSGREVGERLVKAGIKQEEAIKRVIDFMNYCKVGKVTTDETIRIKDNCEAIRTKFFTGMDEPSCYFTTGFLNGLFSAVKNKHVRETKCIVTGDPYCEWEII
jgi:predicted hydrocarbon binding protein/KaiC/GvpD/RAD55 family RecA-like ATPase